MSKTPDVQLCPGCGCYQRRGMLCMKCSKAPFSVEITEPKTPLPPTDTTITIDVREATDAQLQEALELIHMELRIRAFSMASMEPRKQYLDGMLTENTRIVSVPARIGKSASTAVASAFVEPLPLTEEAGYLEGMDRYLSPEWDIPTCPIIGKGPSDHCKHGMGNLDYCPHCEDMDLSEEEI